MSEAFAYEPSGLADKVGCFATVVLNSGNRMRAVLHAGLVAWCVKLKCVYLTGGCSWSPVDVIPCSTNVFCHELEKGDKVIFVG